MTLTSLISSFLMYFLAIPISDLINATQYIELNAFFVLPLAFFMLHYQSLRGLKKSQNFLFIVTSIIFYHINCCNLSFIQTSEVPLYSYLVSLVIVSLLSFLSFQYSLKKQSATKESALKDNITLI